MVVGNWKSAICQKIGWQSIMEIIIHLPDGNITYVHYSYDFEDHLEMFRIVKICLFFQETTL